MRNYLRLAILMMLFFLSPALGMEATGEEGKIAFVRLVDGAWQLFVRTMPDGEAIQLTTDSDHKRDPAWSPGGEWIAYSNHRGEVYVISPDGGDPVLVVGMEHGFFAQPVWMPDGKALLLVWYQTAPTDDSDLWIVELSQIPPASPPRVFFAGEGMEHFPAVCNVRHLLYYSLFIQSEDKPPILQDLFRLDLKTHRVEQVTRLEADSRNASCHPIDGRLVFASNRAGKFDLWTMEEYGEPMQLTDHPALEDQPSWSPCGGRLVFESTREGRTQLWLLELETHEIRKLTQGDDEEKDPAWWGLPAPDKLNQNEEDRQ